LLLAWLERQTIPYELIADGDLHAEPSRLRRYRAVILETHAEYWTSTMIEGLQDFLSRGGALVCLGGDNLHWKTEMHDGGIEVRKPFGVHLASGEPGGAWQDLGISPAAITGVAYVGRATHTYAPFRVLRPDHWAFAGTGVAAGDLIGEIGLFGGASGDEQDRMNRRTPPGAVLLAEGTNPRWGGAQMLWIERADGGRVFAAASVTFIGALAHDSRLARVLRNVLDRVLG
jgi:N,N-dimethylformamidase